MNIVEKPPFRADHVGSLLRSPQLTLARSNALAGQIDAAELRAIEDEAVCAAIALQRDVGLNLATDGELRRNEWHMDFILQLHGLEVGKRTISSRFHNERSTMPYPATATAISGKIEVGDTIFGDAFAFLRDNVRGATPKLTIPSPSMVHFTYKAGLPVTCSQYSDEAAFWADVTAAYADEIRRLYALGCRYLQLDDTALACLNDPTERARIQAAGGDAEHLHETYIKYFNACLADRPDDLTVTTHLCRGNYRSSWVAEGSYDFVAEALLSELQVDGFFLEYDDERSGGFEPLRFLPKGKHVVLGLVTTKRPQLESKDMLKRRIRDAARYVDLDQLCLSPQCGFSSTDHGNDLTHDDQLAKLRLVVETAEEVWG